MEEDRIVLTSRIAGLQMDLRSPVAPTMDLSSCPEQRVDLSSCARPELPLCSRLTLEVLP